MARWWRCSITFMGAGDSAEDMRQRMRLLFDGIPLKDLHLNVNPMSEGEIVRALDREQSKALIEADLDEGVRLTDLPIAEVSLETEPRLLGGMVPAPKVHHPYEQGLWIFPDDHPLAPYERLARQQQDTAALEAMKELPPGDLELEEGDDRQV